MPTKKEENISSLVNKLLASEEEAYIYKLRGSHSVQVTKDIAKARINLEYYVKNDRVVEFGYYMLDDKKYCVKLSGVEVILENPYMSTLDRQDLCKIFAGLNAYLV